MARPLGPGRREANRSPQPSARPALATAALADGYAAAPVSGRAGVRRRDDPSSPPGQSRVFGRAFEVHIGIVRSPAKSTDYGAETD